MIGMILQFLQWTLWKLLASLTPTSVSFPIMSITGMARIVRHTLPRMPGRVLASEPLWAVSAVF
jgi:hypothetical protein